MTVKGKLERGLRTLKPVRVEDWGLTEEDLEGALGRSENVPTLLFGQFPEERVLADYRSSGILAGIEKRGYRDFELRSDGANAFENRVRMFATHPEAAEPCLLMDVRTHKAEVTGFSEPLGRSVRFRALIWEWLSFQDPLAPFPAGVEPLPGQEHPGLGVFRPALTLMLEYVREMDIDALVGLPQFFHNAVLYASSFHFFSPRLEGEFRALRRDLVPGGLARAASALRDGRVVQRESGRKVHWHAAEQVYPFSGEVAEHFAHPAYAAEVEAVLRVSHYTWVRRN